MRCPDCGTEMKPLALSLYCPNDCDRKVQEEIDPEKTPRMISFEANFDPIKPEDVIYVGPQNVLGADDDLDWGWFDADTD